MPKVGKKKKSYVGAGYRWKEAFDNKNGCLLDDAASQAFGAVLRWRRRREPLTAAKLRQINSIMRRQNVDAYDYAKQALPEKLLQVIVGLWASEQEELPVETATPQQAAAAAKKKESRQRKVKEFIESLDSASKQASSNKPGTASSTRAPVPVPAPDRAWCVAYVRFIEKEIARAQAVELHTSPLKFGECTDVDGTH